MTTQIEVHRMYKYRLYNARRNKHLVNAIDIAGIIWNHSLALCKRYYRVFGRGVDFNDLMKHIAKLRNRRFDFWQKLGSQAVQDVIQRLKRAFERFFKKQGGFPKFKKVKGYPSFTLKQAGWKLLEKNKIRLLNHNYKFVKSREIEGEIKTVTVKRDSMGRLWVCFSVVQQIIMPELSTGKRGGFDFGLKHFLTNDEGQHIESPEFFRKAMTKIQALNRVLSSKQDGSNNRKRAKYRLAKAHDHIRNQRRDWFYKLAHHLCDAYGTLYFEDLNLEGMKRLWGRKASDLAFAEFIAILNHVASKRGCRVKQIDRWEPTTQCCSGCGHRQRLGLKDRTFQCEHCGMTLDRDHNAARNILRVGASTHNLEVVRRASQTECTVPARSLV